MIINIIELLRALDYVRGSTLLTTEQKAIVARELKLSLPAKSLCTSAYRTHEIAEGLFNDFPASLQTQEDSPAEQQLPAVRAGEDEVSGNDGKKAGRPKKVARG